MLAGLRCVQGAMPKKLYLWWSFLACAHQFHKRGIMCVSVLAVQSLAWSSCLGSICGLNEHPLFCADHTLKSSYESRWLSQLSVSSSVMGGCPKEHRRETELCLNMWVQSGGLPVGGHTSAAVYLWLIHAEVRQNAAEFCKAIILQ